MQQQPKRINFHLCLSWKLEEHMTQSQTRGSFHQGFRTLKESHKNLERLSDCSQCYNEQRTMVEPEDVPWQCHQLCFLTTQYLRQDFGLDLNLEAFRGSQLFPMSTSLSFPIICISTIFFFHIEFVLLFRTELEHFREQATTIICMVLMETSPGAKLKGFRSKAPRSGMGWIFVPGQQIEEWRYRK